MHSQQSLSDLRRELLRDHLRRGGRTPDYPGLFVVSIFYSDGRVVEEQYQDRDAAIRIAKEVLGIKLVLVIGRNRWQNLPGVVYHRC